RPKSIWSGVQFGSGRISCNTCLADCITTHLCDSADPSHEKYGLARALNISAWVIRDGQRGLIDASELVPGDIVLLQSGDKVPADLRLLQVRELQIDESTLTGESVPVEKQDQALPEATPLVERNNMSYSSTLVTYGTGVGVVVGIGDQTEIGRINRMIGEAVELETPLTRKIGQFSWVLMWFIIGLAALAFAAGWWRGEDLVDTFVASVALAVAAIPEGLPAAVTIILAIGVKRMARRNAIIRKLPAVETLGGTTIICSDKTGTLTQNQMTVRTVLAGGELFEFGGSGYKPEGDIRHDGHVVMPAEHPALQELLKAGLLCNDARLAQEAGQRKIEGDPTEAALQVSAQKAGLPREPADARHPRLDAIPFESAHQFMATLHHNQAEDAHHIYVKGSVESILKRCSGQFDANLNPATTGHSGGSARPCDTGGPRVAGVGLCPGRTSGRRAASEPPSCAGRADLSRSPGHDRSEPWPTAKAPAFA
ncbi:MAG: hypothetical protein RLZZ09_2840, partial [Pseudomonadota bacterium]